MTVVSEWIEIWKNAPRFPALSAQAQARYFRIEPYCTAITKALYPGEPKEGQADGCQSGRGNEHSSIFQGRLRLASLLTTHESGSG